jgi:hypothetical protein
MSQSQSLLTDLRDWMPRGRVSIASSRPLENESPISIFALARELRRLLGTGQSLWPYAAVR